MNKNVVILGAGISGLSAGYWLQKKGIDVTIIDKKSEPGGSMESVSENGFLFDKGPNSALETTPLISQLVEELGLQNEFVYANKDADKRYILKNDVLHPLPMNPKAFIKTDLFSTRAKFRLLMEPFIGKSEDGYYESVAQFVRRRLGQEFLDYAINPFVAGVYAGNPEELSVKSAFPKLYRLEEVYGGLIKGTIQGIKERKQRAETSKQSAKMFTFRSGMQTLPKALSSKLKDKVMLNSAVIRLRKEGNKFIIECIRGKEKFSIDADAVVSTLPAHAAADLFSVFDGELSSHLNAIPYPPVMVIFLGYKLTSLKRSLDGFGFLIPQKEKKSFLGAIWSSAIFPNRAPEGFACFTLFVGGSRDPEILTLDKEVIFKKVLSEFHTVMGISDQPVYHSYRYWKEAIPQYNIGYIEHEKYFRKFENNNKGLYLSGNYRGGIAVGDCLMTSRSVVKSVGEKLWEIENSKLRIER